MSEAPISGRARFDPVINWGHILVAFTIILAGITLYSSNEVRYADLNLRLRTTESLIVEYRSAANKMTEKLTDILIEMSAIKVRLPTPQSDLTPRN